MECVSFFKIKNSITVVHGSDLRLFMGQGIPNNLTFYVAHLT